MDKIEVYRVEELTIATNALKLEVEGSTISIDVAALLKAPSGSEDAWFDIAQLVKLKGAKPREWLRQPAVKEYIKEVYRGNPLKDLNKSDSKGGSQPTLEITQEMLNSRYPLTVCPTIYGRPVVDVKLGRYGGTFLHKDLFMEFASWLDVKYKVAIHRLVIDVLTTSDKLKVNRESTKAMFHELITAIDEKYTPHQSYNDYERHRYQIMDLINLTILGYTAKKFRAINNLPNSGHVRDYLNEGTLAKVSKMEMQIQVLIDMGGITEYSKLKAKFKPSIVEQPLADEWVGMPAA